MMEFDLEKAYDHVDLSMVSRLMHTTSFGPYMYVSPHIFFQGKIWCPEKCLNSGVTSDILPFMRSVRPRIPFKDK